MLPFWTSLEFCKKLTLYQNNILDHSKSKVTDDISNPPNIMVATVLGRAENILGKGENTDDQHFLFFLQCFQRLITSIFPFSKNV